MSNPEPILIKGVVFDLDNTLLDFMKMKQVAVKSAIRGMIEAGLEIDEKKSFQDIITPVSYTHLTLPTILRV